MKWMEIAWADLGTAEVAGAQHNPKVVQYFAEVGRADVTDDETAWCAAFAGACLVKAGLSIHPDKNRRLLARSFLEVGTEISEPRVGALAIFKRGSDPSAGHVGFIQSWTDTTIAVLGGNQSNKVSVANYSRADLLGIRWPTDDNAIVDLLSSSRKYVVASWWTRVTGTLTASPLAFLAADNVAATKSYADMAAAFIKAHTLPVAIAACFLAFCVGEIFKGFMKQDVASGRATPSGSTTGKATP